MESSYNASSTKPIYWGIRVVGYVLGAVESLLAFRFILKLLGANPVANFTHFIYEITKPFVAPFVNVFRVSQLDGRVLEWTTLLAMLVYIVIAWGITRLFFMSKKVSTPEAAEQLNRQE